MAHWVCASACASACAAAIRPLGRARAPQLARRIRARVRALGCQCASLARAEASTRAPTCVPARAVGPRVVEPGECSRSSLGSCVPARNLLHSAQARVHQADRYEVVLFVKQVRLPFGSSRVRLRACSPVSRKRPKREIRRGGGRKAVDGRVPLCSLAAQAQAESARSS
eukprot:6198990-Pleurochrysis_carterae.AAC.1